MTAEALARLQAKFAALPQNARTAIKAALDASGTELAEAARALAPVRTGKLRDSIVSTSGGSATPSYSQPGGSHVVPDYSVKVTAGNSDVRYAHLVEYGTTDAPAQPFFWPAYRILKKRLRSRVSRAVGKAARDAAKGAG